VPIYRDSSEDTVRISVESILFAKDSDGKKL